MWEMSNVCAVFCFQLEAGSSPKLIKTKAPAAGFITFELMLSEIFLGAIAYPSSHLISDVCKVHDCYVLFAAVKVSNHNSGSGWSTFIVVIRLVYTLIRHVKGWVNCIRKGNQWFCYKCVKRINQGIWLIEAHFWVWIWILNFKYKVNKALAWASMRRSCISSKDLKFTWITTFWNAWLEGQD